MTQQLDPYYYDDQSLADTPYPAAETGRISFSRIIAMVMRQKWVVIGALAIAIALGLVLTLLATPIYQATATVRVDSDTSNIVEGQNIGAAQNTGMEVSRYMTTLTEIIKSSSLAERVVNNLKLYNDKELLGEAAALPTGARRQVAASIVRGALSAEAGMNSRIIAITAASPYPQKAAAIANAASEELRMDNVRRAFDANSYARKVLEEQILETRNQLADAERQSVGYARANRIISQKVTTTGAGAPGQPGATTTSESAQTVIASNVMSLNESLMGAKSRRIAAEQRWRTVAPLSPFSLPEVQTNGSIQNLITQRAQAATQLADLKSKYQSDYPQVQQLEAQLATLNSQISTQASNVKNGIRDQYLAAQREESALSGELSRASDLALDEQDRRIQHDMLDRSVEALRTQLADLLARYNEISVASNITSNDVTALDKAAVPVVPSSPNLLKNLLIAIALGLGAGVGLGLLREMFDDRIRTPDEVETKMGARLLGVTPFFEDSEDLKDRHSALTESYSTIRTMLEFTTPPGKKGLVVHVTSSGPSEGKSTTSIALAQDFARSGRRTLLVDADLRKPALRKRFELPKSAGGLVDALLHRDDFTKVEVVKLADRLDLLPLSVIPQNPVEILSSPALDEFVEASRQRYDVILLDSSPVMGLADAPLLARLADRVVFIIEANRAHYGQAKVALRRLATVSKSEPAIVLTKYKPDSRGEDYYYYSYYEYGEKGATAG